jgi:hypothetical protein
VCWLSYYAFGWSAFLCRIRFCDILVAIFFKYTSSSLEAFDDKLLLFLRKLSSMELNDRNNNWRVRYRNKFLCPDIHLYLDISKLMYINMRMYVFMWIYPLIRILISSIHTSYPYLSLIFKVKHIRDSVSQDERGAWISIKTHKGAPSNSNNAVESFWYVKTAYFEPQEKRGDIHIHECICIYIYIAFGLLKQPVLSPRRREVSYLLINIYVYIYICTYIYTYIIYSNLCVWVYLYLYAHIRCFNNRTLAIKIMVNEWLKMFLRYYFEHAIPLKKP